RTVLSQFGEFFSAAGAGVLFVLPIDAVAGLRVHGIRDGDNPGRRNARPTAQSAVRHPELARPGGRNLYPDPGRLHRNATRTGRVGTAAGRPEPTLSGPRRPD